MYSCDGGHYLFVRAQVAEERRLLQPPVNPLEEVMVLVTAVRPLADHEGHAERPDGCLAAQGHVPDVVLREADKVPEM